MRYRATLLLSLSAFGDIPTIAMDLQLPRISMISSLELEDDGISQAV